MAHLLNDIQREIETLRDECARLSVEVADLKGEAVFWRVATLFSLLLLGERLWHLIF